MLIKQVTLTDCGAYAGSHTFDFAADEAKPIILVGGQNGGGKTTIFESVLLCLYGMKHTKAAATRKAYERRLSRMIHRAPGSGLSGAERWSSVSVEFLLHRGGATTEYKVERRWRASKDRVSEEMELWMRPADVPGAEYAHPDAMEPDQWQSFVNGLVPRGIAALFFFDGEMVTQMADGGESAAIRSSFNSLLGLDLVDQLQADLRTNLVRNLSGDDRQLRDELARLTSQKTEAESKAGNLRESRVRKEAELGRVRVRMEDAEAGMERLGGGFAEKRQDIKSRLASKRTELEMTGRKMAELCAAELPLGLVPDELQEVQQQMRADGESARAVVERDIITRTISGIRSAVLSDTFLKGTPGRKEAISGITTIMDEALPRAPPDAQPEVFGFSTPQREAISRMIRNAAGPTLEAAGEAATRYASIREEVTALETALASAPADDEIGPIISGINRMHEEAGRLEAEVDHLDGQAASEEAMIKHISAKIRQVLAGRQKNERSRRMAGLTEAVQRTLDVYAGRLRAEKLGLLESHILEAVRTLMHKDIIGTISINPETFEVSLYGGDGGAVPRETLSKGEQQMLATSILWGLARTSGRPLPFMIDTPLARLDSEHRVNLIERFFPLASHQVIILSTDTEIGRADYARLAPYTSKSYTIRYDPGSSSTRTRRGYFWDGEADEVQ